MTNTFVNGASNAAAQNFITQQLQRFQAAPPGKRSGNELEFPVTYKQEISAGEAIALENESAKRFIEIWNKKVKESAILQGASPWILKEKAVHVSPQDVAEVIAAYESILALPDTEGGPISEYLPEIQAGLVKMQELSETGFQLTVAENAVVHPDNHRLTELVSFPFAEPFHPDSQELARIATETIAQINEEFADSLEMHLSAVADHGFYESDYGYDYKARVPGAELLLVRLLAARHVGFQNPSIANGSLPMAHGGQHTTAGLSDKERLGDVLRVLLAMTPAGSALKRMMGIADCSDG